MKNLSKILSVVLCLALALSLAIVTATAEETTAQLVAKDLGLANAADFTTATVGNVTFTGSVGSNNSNLGPKYYNSGSALRFYVGNTLTITPAAGSEIASVKLIAVDNKYSCNGAGIEVTNGTAVHDGAITVITPADGTAPIVIKNDTFNNYQFRLTSIEVTFAEPKPAEPGQPVCEHAVEDHMAIDVAPTCTEYGFTLHVCTVEGCDGSYADNYVDALGHDFGEATCMQAATCTRCGETSGELGAHNITAKNEEIIYPTCTEEGLAAYWYCGDCCTYFANAECTEELEDQTGLNLAIPATGHNITSSSEGFEATETEDGMIEYYYCGDCCTYFHDAECTEKMEDQTGLNLVIPAKGTSDSPDTGDNTVVLFVVFAMVVMTGLTVMVCKKKYF